jgi:hypothetical protein
VIARGGSTFVLLLAACIAACSSTPTAGDGGAEDASPDRDAGSDAPLANDAQATDGADSGAPWVDTLASNRDRLLATYFAYLTASVVQPQSNGLSGSNVASVCDVWKKLDPSSQAVFLTLTARMQGSKLDDGSSMLWHVTKLYRVAGGQGATSVDPGSCGGAEYNRVIMAEDQRLHDALLAADANKGAKNAKNAFDLSDIPANTSWRDSHDLGGPHAPFDLSDETNQGAPRGQVHFFKDPTSTLAKTALGRLDLVTLVEPMALEMDQDYDCVHASNPICSYITYGALCVPMASKLGTDLFAQNYGAYDASWQPVGCK